MKSLISLTEIVSKQKIKSLKLFSTVNSNESKLKSLYEGIVSGKITTNKDALELLYENTISLPTLNKLKSRLKKRLLNSIFFIDINKPNFTDYKRAKFEIHKEWAVIRLLLDRGESVASYELLKHAYSMATKFEFTQISLLCLRNLMMYYSIKNPNPKKAKYYKFQYEKTKLLDEHESKLEILYNDLSLLSLTSNSADQSKLLAEIKLAENEIEYIFKNYKSILTHFYYYNILTEKYLITKEYEKCLNTCKEARSYFQQKEKKNYSVEVIINNTIVLSYINLRKYSLAIEVIKKNIKLVPAESFSWFKILSHEANTCFLMRDYEAATIVVDKALSSKSLKNFGYYFELFQIQEAYLAILYKTKIVNYLDVNRRFKLSKFLNNFPRFSKDKRGLNVAILVVGLLHLLIKKKYDLILSKMDSLKQYSYRYLRSDHTFRSNCFIKMISKIPDANYNSIALKRHTIKLHNKLESTSYTYSDNPAKIEIIPYETLWKIILKILDDNLKRNRV